MQSAVNLLTWMESAVLSLGTEMLVINLPASISSGEELRPASIKPFFDALDAMQQRNAYLMARAVVVGNATDQALQTLTNPITIRAETFIQYLGVIEGRERELADMKPTLLKPVAEASALGATLFAAEQLMVVGAASRNRGSPTPGITAAVLSITLDVPPAPARHPRALRARVEGPLRPERG